MTKSSKALDFPIANVAHSSNVTRWHAVPCLTHPSVAEHSFLVAMYTEYLWRAIDPDMSECDQLLLLRKSLWHDMPESKTGDISTPMKRYLESWFTDELSPLEALDRKLCPPYAEYSIKAAESHLWVIAKLADVMDAIHFIQNEGKGKVAKRILRERNNAFQRYIQVGISNWPQFNWLSANGILDALLNDEPEQVDFEEIVPRKDQDEE